MLGSQNNVHYEDQPTPSSFLTTGGVWGLETFSWLIQDLCLKALVALGSELDLASTTVPMKGLAHHFTTQSMSLPCLLITLCTLNKHTLGQGFGIQGFF